MNTSNEKTKVLGWGAMQRLQFIEFRLLWDGQVNRSDLINAFGISVPQATLDFREYMQRAPENMDYDKRRKFYFPTHKFNPIFISTSAEVYLSQLTTLSISSEAQSHQGFIGSPPSFDILPSADRRVDTDAFKLLLNAVRKKLSLEVNYQSLSTATPSLRRISPHSFASDGFRWHIRAYCHLKGEFRDFVLGRIMNIRDELLSEINPNDDLEWSELVNVSIAPNPLLSKDQQKIIELDYEMNDGVSVISMRKALLFYLKKRLGIDDRFSSTPAAQQVVITKIEPSNNF